MFPFSYIEKNKILHSKYFYLGIAILTIGTGALFLFWPILSGKFLAAPHASPNLYHYIYFSAMKHFTYDLGVLPNWWPAYDSGYPINLTLDGFLNPIFILALKFLPPLFANNLMIFIFFVINGLSLYALARALKLSKAASLISGISYAFSGVIIQYVDITGIAALLPFLPLSFLCCLKIMQGKKKWFWLWLPLLIYSWIGGWSEMIIYALVATAFFALYLIIRERKSENFSYRHLILFFGAIILSVIILLPWFLSVMHFVSYSERGDGVTLADASHTPTTFSHFLHMIHPRLSVFYGEMLPLIPLESNFFLYIGIMPLLLILASLFIENKKGKKYFIFFVCLAAGSILMTIKHSPLFWLFHQIPVLRWFGGYWKWSFVIVFSLALLAGYGMDNIKDFFRHRFSKYIIKTLWVLMIITLVGIGIITVFDQKIKSVIANYGISHYQNTSGRVFLRSGDYYQSIIEKMSQSIIDNFSFKNKWLLLTIALWLFALIHLTLGKYGLMPRQNWRIVAVLITFLGSTLLWTGFLTGPPASYLKTEPDTAKYLHAINPYASDKLPIDAKTSQTLEPYRIFLYLPEQFIAVLSEKYKVDLFRDEIRRLFTREMMDYNIHAIFNFDAFQNHQTLSLERLSNMNSLAIRQTYTDASEFDEYISAFSDKKNLQLLGSLNIKYILTPFELKNKLKPIFTIYVIEGKVPIFIYENPYFMPRWYFAENVKWTRKDDKIAFEDLKKIDNFKKTTLLEQLNLNDLAITAVPSPKDNLEIQLYTAGNLKIKTKTKNYRFLVFSESRFPDFWQASVNGEKAPIYTANYLYQAALVPPGENIIEFRYPNLWEQSLISAQFYIQSFINKFISQK